MTIELFNQIILPILGTGALYTVRKISVSLKELQRLPTKLEETTLRLEQKYDQRCELLEKRQEVLEEQIALALKKLIESKLLF